jgi:hypothetical protein
MRWVMRLLALVHFVSGLTLLTWACFLWILGFGLHQGIPSDKEGPFWVWMWFRLADLAPAFGLLGVLMIVLGCLAWTLLPRLCLAFLTTHVVLLALGTLAILDRTCGMHIAQRICAGGEGPLSPYAMTLSVFSVPIVVMAVCSIAAALSTMLSQRGTRTAS